MFKITVNSHVAPRNKDFWTVTKQDEREFDTLEEAENYLETLLTLDQLDKDDAYWHKHGPCIELTLGYNID